MKNLLGHKFSKESRRSFLLKVGVGLLAFIPTARTLAKSSTSEDQVTRQRSIQASKPSLKIANIALLDSEKTVAAIHGQPQSKRIAHGYGGEEWVYSGLVVAYGLSNDSNLQVKSVHLTSADGGITSNGIRIGDSLSTVRAIPDLQFREPNSSNLIVDVSTGRTLIFTHANDVVTGISLNEDACATCTGDGL